MTHLAPDCGRCVYFVPGQMRCHRHAPSPASHPFEVTHWPPVRQEDRCGSSAEVEDGDGPGAIACERCLHWVQPDGGVKSDSRQGRPREWWSETGHCTRFAPSPGADDRGRTHWRVTHATDSCGDGAEVDPVEQPVTGGQVAMEPKVHFSAKLLHKGLNPKNTAVPEVRTDPNGTEKVSDANVPLG